MHYHVTLAQGIPSHAASERGDTESLENRSLIKNYEGLLPFLRRQTSWGTPEPRMTSQIFPRTVELHTKTNLLSAWVPKAETKPQWDGGLRFQLSPKRYNVVILKFNRFVCSNVSPNEQH
jgi:hypothetical protein